MSIWDSMAPLVPYVRNVAETGWHLSPVGLARMSAGAQSEARSSNEDKAQQQYDGARNAANAGYNDLRAQHSGGYDPAVLVGDKLEAFGSWSHQKIWDALNDASSPVTAANITEVASTWNTLATDTDTAREDFAKKVSDSVQEKMQGRSAGAFIDATQQFCTELGKLTVAQKLVGRAMAFHGDYLGQAKDSVAQPTGSLNFTDGMIDHLPLQNFVKGPSYRAEEAERDAQRVMTEVYQSNIVREVDPARPVLPTPSNPVTGRGDQAQPPPPGGVQPPPGTSGGPEPNTGGTDGRQGQDGPPQGDPNQPKATDPQQNSQDPTAGTSPAAAQTDPAGATGTPDGGADPRTSSPDRVPGSGGPGTGGGGTGGIGGAGGGIGGAVGPVPGGPGGSSRGGSAGQAPNTQGARPAAASGGAGRPGAAGMPGAMPGAAKGKGEDDEKTVTKKDYLVYDRGSELLGTIPPTLPPGGVIGE